MLDGTPIENQGLIHISRALPSSLKDLRLGPVVLNSSGVESLSQNLPKSLRMLRLSQFVAPQGRSGESFQSLSKIFNYVSYLFFTHFFGLSFYAELSLAE